MIMIIHHDFLCKLKTGFEKDEITVSTRYIVVPEEDRTDIVNGYFENYKDYFQTESIDELDNDQSKILAGLIDGDVWCRKQQLEQAQLYKEAGANIYTYHMDIEMTIDWMLKTPPPYGFGHANDIPFMLGYPYVIDFPIPREYWPYHFCGTSPSPWHYETADILVDHWSQFIKTGKPNEAWEQFQLPNFDTMYITNNASNAIITMQSGLDKNMKFWINKYN